MLKLLAFLWAGCWHKWSIFEERNLMGESWQGRSATIGKSVYLRCDRCGDVKKRTLAS